MATAASPMAQVRKQGLSRAALARRVGSLAIYALLSVGALGMMMPFLYSFSTSLKRNVFAFEFPPQLIPLHPTLQNYVEAWTSNNFQLYFWNSLIVATLTMLLSLVVASTQAYAFARLRFPGKNAVFMLYLITMMIPSTVMILPQFVLARTFGLLNSLPALVVVYVAGGIPFQTFMLRGFFESLPRELEESAYIDGANRFVIFSRIALPLAKPALGTLAIFSFLGAWDEFTWALTVINDVGKRTLPIAIRLFQGQHATQWGLVFAASMIAIVPVMVVFVAFQKYFVRGIAAGAVKG